MACASLFTDLFQVDCQNLLSTGLLHVVLTSCNKSADNKSQQAGFKQTCYNLMELTNILQIVDSMLVKLTAYNKSDVFGRAFLCVQKHSSRL